MLGKVRIAVQQYEEERNANAEENVDAVQFVCQGTFSNNETGATSLVDATADEAS